ncbi:DEAD-box ATP-dependent RNA helicase CshE [Ditylenchus destructor]|uniref:DEAD-box ATP-dependent RNA helicase CshE n=1 Tax=Ditylenchus destructor TaxID=166010 RepID=A0AAD4MJB0_9BILA|nr:DEAD-box ATP-dependent RNA helicase CshE [Ditylenchus destructor]
MATWSSATREEVLLRLANRSCNVLVASDVAARGLDVEELAAVINYELPTDVESYQHRVGRTGRAGASGLAISLVAGREKTRAEAVEAQMGQPLDWQKTPLRRRARPSCRRRRCAPCASMVARPTSCAQATSSAPSPAMPACQPSSLARSQSSRPVPTWRSPASRSTRRWRSWKRQDQGPSFPRADDVTGRASAGHGPTLPDFHG